MNKYTLSILAFFFFSCDKMLLNDEPGTTLEEKLMPPESLNDGWEVSSPEAEDVDGEALRELITDLQHNSHDIHGLLIVKNNKLIAEAYFDGWHRDRLQSMRSASKSVASTLVGIAIDKGYVNNINQSVFDFFPEYADLKTPEKEKIQLQHVLSMKAGLQWEQEAFPDDDPRNDEHQLGESDDGFRYLLEKKVLAAPGTVFKYNSGCSDLLLGIVDHSTGIDADKFAEEYLFNPLGIEHYGWRKNPNGYPNGGYGLHLYPRDMIKIGQLFLDSGKWKGQQVVSAKWVEQATQSYSTLGQGWGYGFQWWSVANLVENKMIRRFQAQGNGGQIICVVPEYNAVVVMTGTNFGNRKGRIPYDILQSRVLPVLSTD